MATAQRQEMRASSDRIWGYDFARFLAISLVIFSHVIRPIAENASIIPLLRATGREGVDIFFALSGILIGGIIFRGQWDNNIEIVRFVLRRFARTVPALFVCLIVFAILLSVPFDSFIGPFFRHLFFIQNLTLSTTHSWDGFFPVYWTLAIEEWFYVLMGVQLFFAKYIRNIFMIFIITYICLLMFKFSFLVFYWNPPATDVNWVPAVWVPLRLDSLLMGVICARWLHSEPTRQQRYIALISGVTGLLVCMFIDISYEELTIQSFDFLAWITPANSVMAALFVAGLSLFRAPPPLPKFVLSPMQFVVTISYSLYLYHQELSLLAKGPKQYLTYIHIAWVLGGGLILGTLSFYLVERPIMRIFNRNSDKKMSSPSIAKVKHVSDIPIH